jgi:hypothetical protein
MDRPCADSRGSLWNKFFLAYIGWTGDVQVVGEVSGATFFFTYIGWTAHVETVGKFLEQHF